MLPSLDEESERAAHERRIGLGSRHSKRDARDAKDTAEIQTEEMGISARWHYIDAPAIALSASASSTKPV